MDSLLRLSRERCSERLEKQTMHLKNKLATFTFNLVVLGEFKRGKSTLINAFLGSSLLPMGATPLTSVATVVRYGAESRVTVKLSNGSTAVADIADLANFVTEKGNPNNNRGVAVVEVDHQAEILKRGFRIVDTPGTGSVYIHNTKTTYAYLPEADAVIFVFIADQPATRAELDLLQLARKYSSHQFFVLNKIDHLDDAGKEESLSFLQSILKSEFGTEQDIFAISAKNALVAKQQENTAAMDPGFCRLENALIEFAINDKAQTLFDSINLKLSALVRDTEQLIELEKNSIKMPLVKLEGSLKAFREAKNEIKAKQTDAEFIMKGEIQRLIKSVEKDLQPVVTENEDELRTLMEQEFDSNRNLGVESLIEYLRSSLQNHIAAVFEQWRQTEDNKIDCSFQLLNGRFVEQGNVIVTQIENLTQELFQTSITTCFEIEPLVHSTKHRYTVDNPFTLSLEMLPLLLPPIVSKQVIRSRYIDAVHHELIRNSGRLRADYQERLEASGRTFLHSFNTKISGALEEIESVIKRAIERQETAIEAGTCAEHKLSAQSTDIGSIKAWLL
jgi:small GTP-binding protein